MKNVETILKFDHENKAPTFEQLEILNLDLDKHSIVAINALAGTGKTTTLLDKVKLHPEKTFRYVALNDSIVKEFEKLAKENGLKNVVSSTIHAYAKRNSESFVSRREIKSLSTEFTMDFLGKKDSYHAFLVNSMFNEYCGQELNYQDFSSYVLSSNFQFFSGNDVSQKKKLTILNDMRKLIDGFYNKTIPFVTHNMYLKHFIDTQELIKEDVLLVDESQDLNNILANFVKTQIKLGLKNLIAVGDTNQSIYGFIKSINILKDLKEEYNATVKTLTRSFRFETNSSMERFANRFLALRGESIVGAAIHKDNISRNVAYIARTNMQVLSKAIELIKCGETYHLLGGTNNIDVDMVMDIWNLAIGNTQMIQSEIVKEFQTKNALKEWAMEKNLVEFISACNFVDQMFKWNKDIYIEEIMEDSGIKNMKIPFPKKMLSLIKAYDKKKSAIILSTFHKSKGLGIDKVVIMGTEKKEKEMPNIPYGTKIVTNSNNIDSQGKKLPIIEQFHVTNKGEIGYLLNLDDQKESLFDEYNLMYVAVTRAKKEMVINDKRLVSSANFIAGLYNEVVNQRTVMVINEYGFEIECYEINVTIQAGEVEKFFMPINEANTFIKYVKSRQN